MTHPWVLGIQTRDHTSTAGLSPGARRGRSSASLLALLLLLLGVILLLALDLDEGPHPSALKGVAGARGIHDAVERRLYGSVNLVKQHGNSLPPVVIL